MTIAEIEDTLIETIRGLNLFATLQSAGREDIPAVYGYPACFVFFDGDKAVATVPRPVDELDFTVAIQVQNLSLEQGAARGAYAINDQIRAAIRGKSLGIPSLEPFTCVSRQCSGYDDADGVIEYTHIYRTRLYQPVVTD